MLQNVAGTSASTETAALSITAGTAATSVAGYFTSSGSPVSLAIGETLNVSLVFSVSNIGTATGTTAFRLGLFNSGSSRAGDAFSIDPVETTFDNYTGYAPLMSTRANASGITIRERVVNTSNFYLNSTANPPFSAALATGASQAFVANTNYTVNISAKRTATSSVDFGIALTGGAFTSYGLSFTDTASPTLSFDTLGIGWAGNLMAAGGVFTVNSLNVSVIPEPASYGALFSLGAVGFVALRRRRTVTS